MKKINVGKIPEKKVRVAGYARVSTDYMEQLGSCENQAEMFMEQISNNPDWEFVGIYADLATTGTTSDRPEFQRMMEDAEKHVFDVLLCKSISRFARNTLVSVQSVRRLQELGITVIFEKENIDTSNKASEVMLTIMSAFAQEESRNISERIKAGYRLHYQNGEALWSELYGYRKVKDEEYVIEENEAAVVRRIFNAFEKGATIRDIVASLNSDGIPSPMKKKWCPNQIASVLKNERYAGDVLTNKYYTKDHISHKLVKNRGDVEQYLLEDHHTPIIGREQFDRVQLIREMKRSSSYPFNGLLICPHCGRKLEFKGDFLGPKRSAWCCELDEFYIAARPLPGAVLEAYRQMEAKEGPAKQVKDEFPEMKTVDYWWLDRLVDSITFGEHAGEDDQTVTINWTDGQTTTVPSGNGLMHKLIHQVRIRERRKRLAEEKQRGKRTVTKIGVEEKQGA